MTDLSQALDRIAALEATVARLLTLVDPSQRSRVIPPDGEQVSMAHIVSAVAESRGLSLADLTGPSKMAHICRARDIACKLAREYGFSLPKIGRFMGGRDHTTVMHCARRAGYGLPVAAE